VLDAHAKDCIRLDIDDEAVMLDFDAPNALLGGKRSMIPLDVGAIA
jgi:hypothetical protein